MPNKTIYIKDADLPLWDRAQRELGESISSVFIDCLREKVGKADEVQAMNALLAEVNAAHNLDMELHPFWSPIILAADSINIGYKLHQKRANPDRIMSLVVHPLDFDNAGLLNADTKNRITAAILDFWDGTRTDRHTFLDATTPALEVQQ